MSQHVSHRASDLVAMTDIVKRLREAREFELRDYEPTMQLYEEAADEIARLRMLLLLAMDLEKAQEREIERLRADVERLSANGNLQMTRAIKAETEIARLRAELHHINMIASVPPTEGSMNMRMHQIWLISRGNGPEPEPERYDDEGTESGNAEFPPKPPK